MWAFEVQEATITEETANLTHHQTYPSPVPVVHAAYETTPDSPRGAEF